MARAEVSVVIDCPADEIFAFLTAIEKGTEWQKELVESTQTSSGPVGAGTTIREVRRFMGRTMEATFQVIDFEPNKKMGFQSIAGPFPISGRYELEPAEGGTRVTIEIEAKLSGAFKMAEPIVVNNAKRQIGVDLGSLKDLLESHRSSS